MKVSGLDTKMQVAIEVGDFVDTDSNSTLYVLSYRLTMYFISE